MQWICDTCGERIETVAAGWIEWQTKSGADGVWKKHSPRLVHHRPASPRVNGCQYDEDRIYKHGGYIVGDLPLDQFVGTDGLLTLLSFVSEGYFELEESLELIKRIQIPNYDLARPYFNEAIGEGIIEPSSKPGYFSQHEINLVKNWIDQQNQE